MQCFPISWPFYAQGTSVGYLWEFSVPFHNFINAMYVFETEGEFRKSQQGKVAATYQPGAFLSFQENRFTDAADSVMTNMSYLTKPHIIIVLLVTRQNF